MIKVLVVDDSAFMRNVLSKMLESDPEITVIGTAANGYEAVEQAAALGPDIITMDLEMPGMDGIEALKKIMAANPVPVIMLSSQTSEGAKVTLHALELGAVDFISKNLSESSLDIMKIKKIVVEKVKHLGRKKFFHRPAREIPQRETDTLRLEDVCAERINFDIVAIGTSTGGPKALQQIIPSLPRNFPVPVLVSQHMPANFTKPFADRLNQLSTLEVKEAEDGETAKSGVVYIAPGGGHMVLHCGMPRPSIMISYAGDFIYRPSVDAMMSSVAGHFPGRAVGVILTGMGHDGLEGLKDLKRAGGKIIAQNEKTCVIYGMPKAVVEAGIADSVLPIDDIPEAIVKYICGAPGARILHHQLDQPNGRKV
ncbi:MAG: chemotaxis response regulator protein-glutamate methylesterase [Nitrospiraceae bacterium]|nr:chemotaxis response regulator protein-glutamate methylesterase [Nitrospiraceae bacterium]